MEKEDELAEGLERAIKNVMRGALVVDGVIINTDDAETKFVCDVQVGDDNPCTYFAVPLRVMVGSQAAFIEIPNVNSNCPLCFRDANIGRPQILFVDSVLKILSNATNVIFNGGQLGGIVKAKELQTQSNKDKQILDALLQILTGPPIDEPGNGAPSALQTALATALAGLQSGTWDQLEDPTITH
jgi:hypothetical protein